MAKQIIVKHYGAFRQRRKRKERTVEKVKRYLHAVHDAWIGE